MMRRRQFMVLCAVLLCAAPALAQSRGSNADPITGTWSGELIPPGDSRRPSITLELKFDGKSTVSGTLTGMPNPGDVKSGTFDAKTGALKLHLGKTDDSAVLIVLEGTVTKGTASGRMSGELGNGEFKLTKKP